MNRNGLEFAKPKPGGEFAYHKLFVMMRALYLTVADEATSLQPKYLSDEVWLLATPDNAIRCWPFGLPAAPRNCWGALARRLGPGSC
jgi:hypothetical protein